MQYDHDLDVLPDGEHDAWHRNNQMTHYKCIIHIPCMILLL